MVGVEGKSCSFSLSLTHFLSLVTVLVTTASVIHWIMKIGTAGKKKTIIRKKEKKKRGGG